MIVRENTFYPKLWEKTKLRVIMEEEIKAFSADGMDFERVKVFALQLM